MASKDNPSNNFPVLTECYLQHLQQQMVIRQLQTNPDTKPGLATGAHHKYYAEFKLETASGYTNSKEGF